MSTNILIQILYGRKKLEKKWIQRIREIFRDKYSDQLTVFASLNNAFIFRNTPTPPFPHNGCPSSLPASVNLYFPPRGSALPQPVHQSPQLSCDSPHPLIRVILLPRCFGLPHPPLQAAPWRWPDPDERKLEKSSANRIRPPSLCQPVTTLLISHCVREMKRGAIRHWGTNQCWCCHSK